MSGQPLLALAPIDSAVAAREAMRLGPMPGAATPALGFAQLIEHGVGELNTQLVEAERALQSLAAGSSNNLHTVMLSLEEARLAMQVASQIKTRILEAYQEVMRMQV